jgi:hypothetical protein
MGFEQGKDESAPCGTKAELEAKGADLSHWGSCAFAEKGGSVRGCSSFTKCDVTTKAGRPLKGSGPENLLVLIRDRETKKAREFPYPCFRWMENLRAESLVGEEAARFVGISGYVGDEYIEHEISLLKDDKNVEKLTEKDVTRTVKAFPRPGEEGSAFSSEHSFREAQEAAIRRRHAENREARVLGFPAETEEDGEEPVKRGPGRPRKVVAPA